MWVHCHCVLISMIWCSDEPVISNLEGLQQTQTNSSEYTAVYKTGFELEPKEKSYIWYNQEKWQMIQMWRRKMLCYPIMVCALEHGFSSCQELLNDWRLIISTNNVSILWQLGTWQNKSKNLNPRYLHLDIQFVCLSNRVTGSLF